MDHIKKYSIKGLNLEELDRIPEIEKLSDYELSRIYNKTKVELEKIYLMEKDEGASRELLDKSHYLDALVNEMYIRGIY